MSKELILLRFGELTLKGRNRGRFENKVLQSVRQVLRAYPATAVTRAFGRIYVELNGEPYEPIAEGLRLIFGLHSFSRVRTSPLELQDIRDTALSMMRDVSPPPDTFKVTVRRTNKSFEHDSMRMNHLIGGHVLKGMPGLKVDVREPRVELIVEIRDDLAYLFTETTMAMGGFPLGSNGRALLLLSGGIDSPVAGWLAMRRGLELQPVHFHSYPYTSQRAKQKVMDLAEILSRYGGPLVTHMVSLTAIQTRLKEDNPDRLLITLMRRSMLRIAARIAEKEEALAIVTGESLGQVASQTLPSLRAIEHGVELPVLRPLVTTDKNDIIRMAEQIGTFETSILPYEDCCTLFVPRSPATNPNLRVVERFERRMSWLAELEEEAVTGAERLIVPERREHIEQLF